MLITVCQCYVWVFTCRLQDVADRIVGRFLSAGLMQQQYDRVKLHITVMNTLFRKEPGSITMERDDKSSRPTRERESFDASNILKVSDISTFARAHISLYTSKT